jgi:hypothetical protein
MSYWCRLQCNNSPVWVQTTAIMWCYRPASASGSIHVSSTATAALQLASFDGHMASDRYLTEPAFCLKSWYSCSMSKIPGAIHHCKFNSINTGVVQCFDISMLICFAQVAPQQYMLYISSSRSSSQIVYQFECATFSPGNDWRLHAAFNHLIDCLHTWFVPHIWILTRYCVTALHTEISSWSLVLQNSHNSIFRTGFYPPIDWL